MKNFLLLFLFSSLLATEEIVFNNTALFEKSLHLETETNINTLIVTQGCNIKQKESSTDPLLIMINNSSINTTETTDTNMLSIGDSENTYPTTIQFTNLPDAAETQNQLKHVGIDDNHQVYIYIDETPPDPSILKTDTIITDKVYGNDADTLFFQANDKSIAIGNQESDLTCIGNKVIFTSLIKTNNENGFHFIAQLETNILSCPTIKTDHLSMGLKKGKSNFINTNNTFIENITIEKNFTLGQSTDPLDLLHITTAETEEFSFDSLDQTTPMTLTLVNIPTVKAIPGILALKKINNQVIFVTPYFSDVITESIECETWLNIGECIFRTPEKILLNTYGSPWTSNRSTEIIFSGGWTNILFTSVTKTLAIENVTFSDLTLENFTSSKQNDNCNCNIAKLNITNAAKVNCNNNVYFFPNISISPIQYQECRYLTQNTETGQLTKSYNRIFQYKPDNSVSFKIPSKFVLGLLPKIFSYRPSYCTDICKKTNKKKERIGFIVEDLINLAEKNILQTDHNDHIINYDAYRIALFVDQHLSELMNSLESTEKTFSIEIIDKKIKNLENINQLYSENLHILEEIVKQLKEI